MQIGRVGTWSELQEAVITEWVRQLIAQCLSNLFKMRISLFLFASFITIGFVNAQDIKISRNRTDYFVNTVSYELKDNLPDGVYNVYRDSTMSILDFTGAIHNQKRVGTWIWFFDTGNKKIEIEYVAGQITNFSAYFPDGGKSVTRSYSHGILNGPFTRWFKDGRVNITGSYTKGNPSGLWKCYRMDGSVLREEQF